MTKATKPLRILVADDHELVRRGIRGLLRARRGLDRCRRGHERPGSSGKSEQAETGRSHP